MLLCKDKSLYCGITTDIKRREKEHNSGKGAAYVKSRHGGKMVYKEKVKNRSLALKREAEIKKWPRVKKLELVKKYRPG